MSGQSLLLVGKNQESRTLTHTGDPSPTVPPVDSTQPPYTHHCQCHAVNLMLIFGLVLPEGAVPRQEAQGQRTGMGKLRQAAAMILI